MYETGYGIEDLETTKKNVQDFREGKTRILMATSIIEEGFDVSTCNKVLVFDLVTTEKSYIQLKGRARMQDSKFLIFTESQSRQKYSDLLNNYKMNHSLMKKISLDPFEINAVTENISFLKQNQLQSYEKYLIGNSFKL